MARIFAYLLIVTIGLTACVPQNVDVEPTLARPKVGSLQIYSSPVPSSTPLPPTPAPTHPPPPTATPHLYAIKKGDTMGSISLEFGISVEEIIRVNPETSPYSMTVGEEIVIPEVEITPASLAIAPLEVEISPPNCYEPLSGGMWCFISVLNNQDIAVENPSAEIMLFDENGEVFAEKIAYALIDRLPVGERMPLVAFFENIPENMSVNAKLLTALPSPEDNGRYLLASVRNVLTEIAWSGVSAKIKGDVMVEGEISRLWVLAIAYDADDNILGVRRWESVSGKGGFNLTVSSLGSTIDHVQLMVEAKTLDENSTFQE
ncbi:MAG: LysM peptidoglycan-binding domain-containing protein [Anaerolineae bacterium]|jgi:LysM repeat protein|nr:LysM peptidoglycan-binding domain-containing protein [Anaerolineae bacterium]MBT7074975.1 LysM peptidoglycan-binding domain-containing protein [Anaerolineae bacterium]MBT7781871.1 LysM peptidoglycan-binding domain-containing protein [Anaerolineae bacterium]